MTHCLPSSLLDSPLQQPCKCHLYKKAYNDYVFMYIDMCTHIMNALTQVCVLCIWLLTSSTGVASIDYRTMWVSTAGVDSPQCILDTLASGPLPHPRHLNYACIHGLVRWGNIHIDYYNYWCLHTNQACLLLMLQ